MGGLSSSRDNGFLVSVQGCGDRGCRERGNRGGCSGECLSAGGSNSNNLPYTP